MSAIKTVAMDMWEPYIAVVREQVRDADGRVAFDKYHVASHLGNAFNEGRH
jgi:transposase